MGVRNCAEIGENLQKIIRLMLGNQNLLKYLYYTDKDPLSNPDIGDEIKEKEIFEKLVKIVPSVGPREDARSVIVVRVVRATKLKDNSEFRDIEIAVEVFVPITQWIIKNTNLRPFAILGEVQKTLDGKKINGLGRLTGGDFAINFLTEEMSCYEQEFYITTYD